MIAASRSEYITHENQDHIKWMQVDFSRQQTLSALEGVDIAIYLVYSMLPKSSLFQGEFYDLDLLMADNFAY